ncbi:helix-turn-helix transcriptional regulator [Halomonas alkaliantarctica]|uniref:Helix-turn-helix transcriptional regulator n=1 Tax=Halomonas alkaliantarctica TaxID=232346 RepID=A0ABY8LHH4_9GAMM|nr:helix-turn-helix transcriptional regulator [Halomonas alkaliantarctica]WGI23918.1 helix-turn-helix transcriptional regulator [Halomonas alkaliantarctica]
MADFILPSNANDLNFRHRLPDKRLAPWVQCLWSIGGSGHLAKQRTEKFYPDAGASLSIKLTSSLPDITLCFNKTTLIETLDTTAPCLGIRFKAAGIYCLLGFPPEAFTHTHHRLDNELEPLGLQGLMPVVERLYQLDSQQGLRLLETWLLHRLESQPPPNRRITSIVQAIGELKLPPQQLGATLGFTRRTLERKLKREVGVTPGQLVAYSRLNRARHGLLATTLPITEIALKCGYYDQAHFTHAFQSLAYETPAAYRKRKLSQIYKA